MTRARALHWLALAAVTGLALALRLFGLDWDQGHHLHPDERFLSIVLTQIRPPTDLAMYFDPATSPYSPFNQGVEFFVYGTLPIFLVDGLSRLLDMQGYDQAYLVGRAASAIADTGTVVVVYLLGRRLLGAWPGLLAALLMAVDDGFQGAFMVPTEVLAEQQYKSLVNYLEPLGVNVRLLVGSQRTKERRDILSGLSQGTVDIVVGTHALFQESVKFKQLVLAVIDEQHRFGVRQRGELLAKGNNPHALLMTATPIPRSLALTRYGDLDISLIKDLPGGRRPIRTRLRSEKRRGEMHDLVSKELARGHQVYVVFPQVEESEMTDLKDAQRGFEEWKKRCPNYRTALVHGQMPADEKERAMNDFKANLVQVLVATTVIEVGVDTPNATVMVIEHAERFGLSQLHQMRGRVGRGTAQSYCILMASYAKSAEAKVRLRALERTTDGFKISDEDLRLRGQGEFFGTRQSGLPDLRIADIVEDQTIVEQANSAVATLVARDADLEDADHQPMRQYFEQFYVARLEGFAKAG